jgi:hypothetical protein
MVFVLLLQLVHHQTVDPVARPIPAYKYLCQMVVEFRYLVFSVNEIK